MFTINCCNWRDKKIWRRWPRRKNSKWNQCCWSTFWWPGLEATYINTDDVIDAAKDRQEYLAKIYDEKCSENSNIKSVSKSIENELNNLKRMHAKGLITDEEYKAARKKALGL